MFIPFIPLPEIERKIHKFKAELNGNTFGFFWWKKYRPENMPLIIKSKKPISILTKDYEREGKEKYVGILDPAIGRVYYKVEDVPGKEENKLIFTIYGILRQKGEKLDSTFFSPAVNMFLLKKQFIKLVDATIEKSDLDIAIARFLVNLYEQIKNSEYEEFLDFCRENGLKYIVISKDDVEFLVPFNFINKENYVYFDSFFYLSLMFWLLFGKIEIRIIE